MGAYTGLKSLAEAVILQSLEDLWNPDYKVESKEFFEGVGFKICSDIADIDSCKQFKILYLLGGRKHAETAKLPRY